MTTTMMAETAPEPYASPTFSSTRRSKLKLWREKHRSRCSTCTSPNIVQRFSIQSIAKKHARKDQIPTEINVTETNHVSPLSMNQSSSSYGSSSGSSSSFEVLEEPEEERTKKTSMKDFPRQENFYSFRGYGGKENQVNQQRPQKHLRPTARKSLLDRRARTTTTQYPKNETSSRNILSLRRLSDQPELHTFHKSSHETPPVREAAKNLPVNDPMASMPWSPDFDDILSEYDEHVRSVYMETAAADDESQSQEKDPESEEYDLPDSSIQFFRNFRVSDEWSQNMDLSDKDDTSPLMFQHRRRRNMSLHPLCEDPSSSSIDATPNSSHQPAGNDPAQRQESPITATSNQSSPSFVVPTRRRRMSVVAPVVHNDTKNDASSSCSSSDSGNDSDEESDEGQATVIADREELLGGLPLHEGRTVLTTVSERRVALDVDMMEHRRLALECRKLRDRLVLALAENHDKNREFQRLQLEAPKLQEQLIEARNEVSRLKIALRHYQV